MNITTAIVPAAGLGTRLLPLTKALPKELMPVLHKPALQYTLEEGAQSGITNFCIIMNDDKRALVQNYFAPNAELDAILAEKNRAHLVKDINNLINTITMSFVAQPEPLGLGHAVLMGRDAIPRGSYFGVFLPDDILAGPTPAMQQLIDVARTYNASVIAVEEVPHHKVSSYGIIAPKQTLSDTVVDIETLVEKPHPDAAPSHLGIIGRYVLSDKIFDAIEAIAPHANGEIQLTDAIDYMLKHGERVVACIVDSTRYDIGSVAGLLHATVDLGLNHPDYQDVVLKSITKTKNS